MAMTVTLSNGEPLTMPDNVTDEQAQQYYDQAESALKAEAPQFNRVGDDGAPVPVEAQPKTLVGNAIDYAKSWVPEDDPFAAPRTWGEGLVKGVYKDLPNAIPNTVNEIKGLNDLWRGSGKGEVAPEDQWQPWTNGTVPFTGGKTVDDLMPVKPGWEGVEGAGRLTGVALPAVASAVLTGGLSALPAAATAAGVALPAVVKVGQGAGQLADMATGNEDSHKYERTLGDLAPLLTGAVRIGRGVPVVADSASFLNKSVVKPVLRYSTIAGALSDPMTTGLSRLAFQAGKVGADRLTRPGVGPLYDANRMVTDTGASLRRDQ